jgi:hypothetical protein
MSKYLVDMDLFLYRVSSACDGKRYLYRGEEYESIKEMTQIYGSSFKREAVETVFHPESVERTRESFDKLVDDKLSEYPFIDDYFVGGRANFRYKVATIRDYKGTRSSIRKPEHLDMLKQYAVEKYGAKLPFGPIETDDMIAYHASKGDTIITIDKDFKQIADISLYDFVNEEVIETTELSAYQELGRQCIFGDSCDCIPGIVGCGEKSKPAKDILELEDTDEIYSLILGQYEKKYYNYGLKFFRENFQLLYLLRSEGSDINWVGKLGLDDFYKDLRGQCRIT